MCLYEILIRLEFQSKNSVSGEIFAVNLVKGGELSWIFLLGSENVVHTDHMSPTEFAVERTATLSNRELLSFRLWTKENKFKVLLKHTELWCSYVCWSPHFKPAGSVFAVGNFTVASQTCLSQQKCPAGWTKQLTFPRKIIFVITELIGGGLYSFKFFP